MKVCLMSFSSITNQDGASLSMINIADELTKRGYEVVIVVKNTNNLSLIDKNKKIKIITTDSHNMRVNIEESNWSTNIKFLIKSIINKKYLKELYEKLKAEDIDLIHINGLNHTIAARIADKLNIPYVWHIRQLMEEDLGQRLFNEKEIFSYLNKSDAIIAISQVVKDKFKKYVTKEIDVVYNGVPVELYNVEGNQILEANTIELILPGRIDIGKGQLQATKAIKILVDKGYPLHLNIVGNIEDRSYNAGLLEYIKNNDLEKNVTIKDFVSDLRTLRSNCDIGLTCSVKEAFGRVTIENQLAGLLVIGANSGGTVEIVDDGKTGLLYDVNSYEDLAAKIEYAINNKDAMKTIAQVGREEAFNKFSITRVVDEVIKIYDKVM